MFKPAPTDCPISSAHSLPTRAARTELLRAAAGAALVVVDRGLTQQVGELDRFLLEMRRRGRRACDGGRRRP